MQEVPRVRIETDEDFSRLLREHRPAILENFQDSWRTGSLTAKELAERFGSSMVRVSVSQSGRFDGPENGTLWGLGPSVDVLVRYRPSYCSPA